MIGDLHPRVTKNREKEEGGKGGGEGVSARHELGVGYKQSTPTKREPYGNGQSTKRRRE